ncbi:hypothetical protein FRC01_005216 [Tulasnella sp. 417]|nr:hypothetical protein FRC01_005216 [Tulasnella sp. 417]
MSGPTLPPPQDEDSIPPPQDMSSIPKLPPIVATDILTHFVLPSSSADTSVDGINMGPFDFDRLGFLGSGAIQFAVTKVLFDQDKHPNTDLEALRKHYTQPRTLARWGALYDNFSNLGHGLGNDEADGSRVFSAYVGGVYHQDGMKPIQEWIQELIPLAQPDTTVLNSPTPTQEQLAPTSIQPDGIPGPSSSPVPSTMLQHASTGGSAPTQTSPQRRKREREAPSDGERRSSPTPKRTRVSSTASNTLERHPTGSGSSSSSSQQTPSNPVIGEITPLVITQADVLAANASRASTSSAAVQPDTRSNANAVAGPSTSSQPQKKWVSVLNEGCMSTKSERKWDATSAGADHNKTWRATLTIATLGVTTVGEGKTKKLAQEEAARQACERLNWTPGYKWSS